MRSYRGRTPQVAASAYIDPAAVVIGDVSIGEHSSVWPCAVIRGDVHWIRIGARTNIQDGSVLHVMRDEYPLLLGDNVTIGHGVILHGCTIESRVRSEEHTSELQSLAYLVCRLLLEKKKTNTGYA